jgi:signal transduction histidine kinase
MIDRILTVTQVNANTKNQTVRVNIDENIPPTVVGDDQRLAQVIINLLANAIKFSHEGGEIALDVSLTAKTAKDCELRVDVTDNGIGIAPEHHDRLFDAFEQAQTDTTRTYGGTGLGLAISKRIIEAMGGSIWVVSDLGEGSTFSFTLCVEYKDN